MKMLLEAFGPMTFCEPLSHAEQFYVRFQAPADAIEAKETLELYNYGSGLLDAPYFRVGWLGERVVEKRLQEDKTRRLEEERVAEAHANGLVCCLLTNMFDPQQERESAARSGVAVDWQEALREDIMEPLDGVPVVGITVDSLSPSGQVFVECATENDAREVLRRLGGRDFGGKRIVAHLLTRLQLADAVRLLRRQFPQS